MVLIDYMPQNYRAMNAIIVWAFIINLDVEYDTVLALQ